MELSPLHVMLLLILLLSVPNAQGNPKAVVFIKPANHVFTCERVTLRCDIRGGGDTEWTYSWYRNNDRLHKGGERFSAGSTEQEVTISCVLKSDSGTYTCRGQRRDSQSSEISDAVTLTVSGTPQAVLSVSPQSWLTEGDSVTLNCEVTDSSTDWTFSWYRDVAYKRPEAVLSVSPQSWLTEGDSVTLNCEVTDFSTDWTFSWYNVVPSRHGATQIITNHSSIMYVELLSDSSRGSGGSYTLSPAALKHTGVYVCRGEWTDKTVKTFYSNLQPLWITDESPPVSLIINPNRTQHFTGDSLSLSCEDQSNSTGWTVRRYTESERVSDCSKWGSVTGSTCKISSLDTSYTGVYWCESESKTSNPVNITVHDGDVIWESPVHAVTEGHPLTLRCLVRKTKRSNFRPYFYKDGSVLQTQTTGEMIINKVSKSDEGFYHCKHPERGESLKSWVSVRGVDDVEAPFSLLMLISSVVTPGPYLLVTIILLVKCYRARVHTEEKIKASVVEE
ncbi:uncharacterized protein LOC128511716 [Clarias gariepinus]|uniref:uncharacterized protein LOC128511716 n=1 Tax=Clarias gariepinus TaxID=13013 RepID=UPI00234C6121|nr:uncharacterized protein LOC128511716 [Clarias gariepinus]